MGVLTSCIHSTYLMRNYTFMHSYALCFGYARRVDETTVLMMWPDSMLRRYGDMLSVADVSCVLRLEPRNVRCLLTSGDAAIRLPGVKIGKSWRIARDQLRVYLIGHHNDDSARTQNAQRGTS